MKLRQHRRNRSFIQGKLTRSASWMPVDLSSSGVMTMGKVRLDMRWSPRPMHGQTYAVFENVPFGEQPTVTVGPEVVSLTQQGFVRGQRG